MSEPPDDGVTRRQPTSVAAATASWELAVVEGRDAGARAVLDTAAGKLLVGTGALCELRLTDPTVSRLLQFGVAADPVILRPRRDAKSLCES